MFDLILAQGLYAGRYSGLVSVSPTITEPSLRMYAVAVSFSPVIGGQDVVREADVQESCNRFDCLVFHSRNQLQLDFNPVHHMTHGDSFVVYLSRKSSDPTPSTGVVVANSDPAPEPDAHAGVDMEIDNHVVASPSAAETAPPKSVDQASQTDERRRVTLYRLDRPTISVWMRWRRYPDLLQDVLAATAIHPSDMVALHPLLVKPVGESLVEFSVILQQQGDVLPGSDDSLVLIDTVFHQQGAVGQRFADTIGDRQVIKVPLQVSRQGLLYFARVANYCELSRNTCLVSHNHQIWNAQAAEVKTLLHGSYCRIQVPPSNIHGVETCRAVSLVENASSLDPPTFAQAHPTLPHHTDVNVRANNAATDAMQVTPSVGPYHGVQVAIWQHHSADTQQGDPPAFERPIPDQAPPVVPNIPNWHSFQQDLSIHFEEHSVTDIPEEGPVLFVTTWFIHHDHAPMCLVGRFVRLSNRPHEWMQLMCAPWIHMLRPFENIAFRLVRPGPVSDIPGSHMAHVIIEQGLQQSRFTALFSVIFQGLLGDMTHRRAQSIPTELSRDTIERILDISALCRARRCVAWSGRLQFHHVRMEPVFSGIGVCFTVDAFRNRFAHVDDDGYPLHSASSSSCPPPRMPFREDDASLFPSAADATRDVSDFVQEHAPSRLIPELTLVWQKYLMTTETRPFRFYIETWFCDHDGFPRTDRGREVLLHPDPEGWRQAILDKWNDMIDANAPVTLYVVSPPPFGGPTEVLAHVILAQHQHRGFVSSLVTTLAPGDDPWDPPRVALKLPSVVDKGLLIQESGLFMFCPPFIPFNDCSVTYGDQVVFQDVLRPANSGDSFLCVAESPGAALASSHVDTSHDLDVHKLFDSLSWTITQTTMMVLKAAQAHKDWQQCVEKLQTDLSRAMQEVQLGIHDIAASLHFDDGVDATMSDFRVSAHPCSQSPKVIMPSFHAPSVCFTGLRCTTSNLSCQPLHDRWKKWSKCSASDHDFIVAVWFVDHLRSPSCFQWKQVTLNNPDHDWTHALLQPWAKDLWPFSDVLFFLMDPVPATCPINVHAHVLVLQHPIEGLRSIFLSVLSEDGIETAPKVSVATVPVDFDKSSAKTVLAQHYPDELHFADGWFEIRCGLQPWPLAPSLPLTHATQLVIVPCSRAYGRDTLDDPAFAALLHNRCRQTETPHCHNRFIPDAPGPHSTQVSVPCPGFPVTISLDAVLPKCRETLPQPWHEHLSTLAWSRSENWYDTVIESIDIQLSPIPADLELTHATMSALFEAFAGTIGQYDLVEIFVDGATSSVRAGWSVVVVVHSNQSVRLLGTLAGPVVLGPMHDCWLGATTIDNIAAELSALVAALALALFADFPCPVHIRPDLTLSRLVAQELVTTVSNPTTAKIARLLAYWLPPNVEMHKVRGHTSHAWNDLADSLARHVLLHPDKFPPVSFGQLHLLAKEPHDLDWAWSQRIPDSLKHCMPNIVEQSVWQFPPSLRKVSYVSAKNDDQPAPMSFHCKVTTINVLALDKAESQTEVGRRTGARTLRLDHQLHAAQYHLAGLQETRTLTGSFCTDHYFILSSGCVGPGA